MRRVAALGAAVALTGALAGCAVAPSTRNVSDTKGGKTAAEQESDTVSAYTVAKASWSVLTDDGGTAELCSSYRALGPTLVRSAFISEFVAAELDTQYDVKAVDVWKSFRVLLDTKC